MTIEEEIARAMRYAIRPDVPVHLPVPRMYEDMTAALSPLLNRVRAEALREARDNVRASSFWADGSDNYADRVRGYLSNAADRIEQNSEGSEQ